MVFHEIDSVTDVLSGHRIIIYYIQGKIKDTHNGIKLVKILEAIMSMLEKKNDDLLIVKVLQTSSHFNQFQELYKSDINGIVTLFAVNNEGIPITYEHINKEEDIINAFESLSEVCNINCITKFAISKIIQSYPESVSFISEKTVSSTNLMLIEQLPVIPQMSSDVLICSSSNQSLSTELRIRLPNGNIDIKTFAKNAKLQEVWIYISVKYNLKDFDMKTFSHQAFSEEDYDTTLLDLELYPNGVLMVVNKNVPFISNRGGISAAIQSVLHSFTFKTISLVQYVKGLVLMFWNSLYFPNNRPRRNSDNYRQRRNEIGSSEDATDYSNSQARPKKSRGFGNIHTLHRDSDSDDENNRYNGNSTQQK